MQDLTLTQFLEIYRSEVRSSFKSFYSMSSVLDLVENRLGHIHVESLTGVHIHDYVQARLNRGIKATTINRELSIISAAVNHGIRKHGLDLQNPVRYQWVKPGPLRVRYLTKAEAKNLYSQALRLRNDFADFIVLAINTGCRKSELLNLRWHDVDMQYQYITIRAENSKSNKPRRLPLNANAFKAIQNRQHGNETEWVFQRKGKRVKGYNWLFRKAIKSANIEDFRIHDLRHTFASWLVTEGVELVKVRDLLGHSSIKMTERYAHLMPEKLRGAVEVLDLFQDS